MNETRAIRWDTRGGWLDVTGGVQGTEERRFLLPAGNRKLLAKVPLHSGVFLYPPPLSPLLFSRFPFALPFHLSSIPLATQPPSSSYLGEPEKWFLTEEAGKAFPSLTSPHLSLVAFLSFSNLQIYIYRIYIYIYCS